MTPAILFIALGLLAILFGPPLLGLALLVCRSAAAAAVLVFRLAQILLTGAGYVAALLMWGVWLCVDRRGALAAYRDCPKPDLQARHP
jgi:hypothetical protein